MKPKMIITGMLLGLLLLLAGLTIFLIAWKNGSITEIQIWIGVIFAGAGAGILWEDIFKPIWTERPWATGGHNG